ncbi:TetR/AcrR family transcriptional regulator [Kutzneria sp. NPDC052558]|uniref:TetR/AcrR family transcriptional regulator n=1 Tax=Kutzneria sp. NPDC052558 TaxID=3364121 RepID=UPI0037C8DB87
MTVPRADARRNREAVLRTAAAMFAEDGLDVSLGRIAQRAGVGAGTVYRHFPSKDALVEAVLVQHLDGLVAAADRWAVRAAPADALIGFLLEVIEKSMGSQPVCDAATADHSWPHAALAAAQQRFRAALGRLLANAKRAGVVRGDVQVDDLSALAVGGASIRGVHRNKARGVRLVRVLLDGLIVTQQAAFRDGPRHETGRHCAECGSPLQLHGTGRPARFCGPTCRQRARRRRVAS